MRMKVNENGSLSIGELAPGAIVLGRTVLSPSQRYAGSSFVATGRAADFAAAHVVAPTFAPLRVKSAGPELVAAPDSGGIPSPVLIGAGAIGVLAIAAVVYKLTR
jgi:hypothetical protein